MIQKIKDKLYTYTLGAFLPILLILLWNWGVKTEVLPPTLIASPANVWSKFVLLISDNVLFINAKVSLIRLFAGFLLGSFIGITLGVIVGISKVTSKIIEPLLLVLIPVPPLAWIPLLIIAFGIDQGAKIALLSIGSFCTLFLTTSFSVKATDKNLIELSKLYSKEWYVKLFKIILPFSASSIIGSLRVAMALSWTLLMASEMIASSAGLGWFIWDSRNFSRPDDMLVGMLSVGFLGWLTDKILVSIGNYFNRWKGEKRQTSILKDLWLLIWHFTPFKDNWYNLGRFCNRWLLSLNDLFADETNLIFSRKGKKFNEKSIDDFSLTLEVNVVEKNFNLNGDKLKVLNNLNIQVNSGEYISIIGPSGCGKSTLLKLIAGLDTDYAGEIKNDGEKIMGTSLSRCVVFQEQRLLSWLKVTDNISFALPTAMKRREKRKRVADVIELVGLTGFGNVFPAQLSGGMQQRTALARAMVNLPEILLLDEPFGALDSITRDKMQKELKKILSKEKTTVLMVTHDIDEAIVMSNKVIVLGGKPTAIKNLLSVDQEESKEKTSPAFIEIRNELINELYN